MKQLLISICLICAGVCTSQGSLIISDSFNYAPASSLGGQGNWVNGNSGDEVTVISGNLSVSGLASSSGNMISLGGSGMDPYQTLLSARNDTTYFSVILKITDLGSLNSSGGYVLGLASGTSLKGQMWLKSDGFGGFMIGVSKTADSAVAWSSTSYAINSTVFVVGDYVFNTGLDNDIANLWVDPDSATFGGTAPFATLTTSTSGTDSGSLTRFYFRQDSSTTTPGVIYFDELRIGTTWADVTPIPESPAWGYGSGAALILFSVFQLWRQRTSATSRALV